jgi:hypothetical protein
MGRVIYFETRKGHRAVREAARSLPHALARLIWAGHAGTAAELLSALGRREIDALEALDVCTTMVAVAGERDPERDDR